VIGQQQVRQSEDQRRVKRGLERFDDVLVTGAEKCEQ
jgi:hypothetical protein